MLNEGEPLPGVSAVAFALIDRTMARVAVLEVMRGDDRARAQQYACI
jgi:hypothetical protein